MPNYFIGRSFTGDGLLGDPINIAINGSEKELIKLFLSSGWSRAEKLTFKSAIKITIFSIFKKSYPNAPVSFLYLFHRKPSFVFEKEIDGNPRRRHHVRVWKTPDDWYLPGGSHVDWLCAATYDERVGISMFTGQITHKIAANIDEERDLVLQTFYKTKLVLTTKIVVLATWVILQFLKVSGRAILRKLSSKVV